ncbi:hypothetical protein [Candidatus Borreliella tachyglossi]|uniref:hypothetical protein n=1 Tax=Candidatus Borreliella tachyglossi TaxID=1964448 RepID=UPI004041078B
MFKRIIEVIIYSINALIGGIGDCAYHIYGALSGKEIRELRSRLDAVAGELKMHRQFLDAIAENRVETIKGSLKFCSDCEDNIQTLLQLEAEVKMHRARLDTLRDNHIRGIDMQIDNWNVYEKHFKRTANLQQRVKRLQRRANQMQTKFKIKCSK